MNSKEALLTSYKILSPYSDKQFWEFNNNLVHLNFLIENIPKNLTIFDAGCGIGILDLALIQLGYKVDGADKHLFNQNNPFYVNNLDGLKNIWEKYNLKIFHKDITTENMGKKYDVVISVATIEHQKDPKTFLNNLLQILNMGGLLYLATPNVLHLLNRLRFLFGRPPIGNLKNFFENGECFAGHWREYTLSELEKFYQWLGLEIIESKNVQSMKPFINFKKPRSIYVSLFIILSRLFPNCGDTNMILGIKK